MSNDAPPAHPDIAALLQVLARAGGAGRILEIGTGRGDTTLAMAAALPAGGTVITMEIDAAEAARARERFAAAGYADRVSVIVGDATRFLHKVAGPFDLIFQDSDPALYAGMLDRLAALLRPGGLLVTNAIRSGPESKYSEALAAHPLLDTSFLPVGDGVSVSVKRT
jgi:predicted O-methyltransferase YrrM